MKERIAIEQFNELSLDQKETIHLWWFPKEFDVAFYKENHTNLEVIRRGTALPRIKRMLYPLLSVGQMLDFLQYKDFPNITHRDGIWTVAIDEWGDRSTHLCDALWEVLKRNL